MTGLKAVGRISTFSMFFSNCPDTGMSFGGGPPIFPFSPLLSLWSSESLQGLAAETIWLSFQSPVTASSLACTKFPFASLTPPTAPTTAPPVAPAVFPGLGCFFVGSGGGRIWAWGSVWLLMASSCSRELVLRRVLSWSLKQLVAGVERRALAVNSLAARQCLSWYVRPDMRLLTEPMAVPELQGPQGPGQGPEGE